MSLCDHLGTQKYVRLSFAELGQQLLVGEFRLGGVHIHADYPGRGLHFADLLLQQLRAVAAEMEVFTAAVGAEGGHVGFEAAVVAGQDAVLPAEFFVVSDRVSGFPHLQGVIGQRDGAVGAGDRLSADTAGHDAVVAPAVEENDGLPPCRCGFGEMLPKNGAQGRNRSSARLAAHIRDENVRQCCLSVSVFHLDQGILTAACFVVTADGGCGGCQQHQGFMVSAAEACHVVGAVFGIRVGFVGVFLFFVDDDHAHVGQRGEYGRAGTDDHACLAVPDPSPGVVPFTGGEGGVDHGHVFSVAGKENAHHLRGQRNFRHQNDDAPAIADDVIDHRENHPCFSGAGDTVEQGGFRFAAFVESEQRIVRRFLFGRERTVAHVPYSWRLFKGIAVLLFKAFGEQSLFQ